MKAIATLAFAAMTTAVYGQSPAMQTVMKGSSRAAAVHNGDVNTKPLTFRYTKKGATVPQLGISDNILDWKLHNPPTKDSATQEDVSEQATTTEPPPGTELPRHAIYIQWLGGVNPIKQVVYIFRWSGRRWH